MSPNAVDLRLEEQTTLTQEVLEALFNTLLDHLTTGKLRVKGL